MLWIVSDLLSHSSLINSTCIIQQGLPCWRSGGMRLIALLQLMMLSGTQDGEGSGTGESLVEIGSSLGCLLGCLLAQREVNVERVIISIE